MVRFRQQGFSGSGRTDQKDIGFLQFDPVVRPVDQVVADPLVMVVDRDGKDDFRPVLADDILVQESLDLLRLRSLGNGGRSLGGRVLVIDLVQVIRSQADAVAADIAVKSVQEEGDFVLSPSAKHAVMLGCLLLGHYLLVRISSIMPYSFASAELIQ